MPHELSVVVPGLCGPLPGLEAVESAAMPLLEVLTRCRRGKAPGHDLTVQLAELFGMNVRGPFPHAALTLLAHDIQPGEHCWIHADPVNLQADMDRALLSDSRVLQIEPEEAEQLVAELNAHFAEDNIRLEIADENNWMIRLDRCDLETTPLSRAVGRNVNHLLPGGKEAPRWRRLLNEAQMLLHMSAVNQAREQRGLPAINSLWLWGEGVLPAAGRSDITQVYADESAATGIARLNHIRHSALTDPIVVAYAMKQPGHSLVVLDQLAGPCNYGDTTAWLEDMLGLVADWLNPLLATARSLEADVCIYPCNGVRYHFGPNNRLNISRLMFWKKERLRDHVETH